MTSQDFVCENVSGKYSTMKDLCRLCGKHYDHNMISIFEDLDNFYKLEYRIHTFLPFINVSNTYNNLYDSFEF